MKKLFALSLLSLTLLAGCFHASPTESPPLAETPATTPAPTATEAKVPAPAPTPTPTATPPAAVVAPQIITLDSGNLYFRPKNITVKVNQPVTVQYTNKGTHSFTVDELGIDIPFTKGSGSFNFIPKKTGTFVLYCNVEGHRLAGMAGKITVEE